MHKQAHFSIDNLVLLWKRGTGLRGRKGSNREIPRNWQWSKTLFMVAGWLLSRDLATKLHKTPNFIKMGYKISFWSRKSDSALNLELEVVKLEN